MLNKITDILNKKILCLTGLCSLFIIFMIGCGNTSPDYEGYISANQTGFFSAIPGNYDSADTAVIISINEQESTITFKTLAIGKKYTLNYDGATLFFDKNNQPLTLAQIRAGEIVDVTFMKDRKRLNSLAAAADSFVLTDVAGFEVHSGNHKMMIGREDYTLSDDLVIICPNGEGELMDINDVDVLSVLGFNHMIYSIIVDRSHGYLRLTGDDFFVGGFIEVDGEHVYKIEEEMLLAVPAGTYPVTVSNAGCIGTETLTIEAGCEYEWDISKFRGEPQKGKIIFTVIPTSAQVYIDGASVDISSPVELEYGIHQMTISADGYKTIMKYIKVGSESSTLNIVMETLDDSASANSASANNAGTNSTSANSISSNTVSDNNAVSDNSISANDIYIPTATPTPTPTPTPIPTVSNNTVSENDIPASEILTTSSSPRVYIDAPENVEVYVNGIYVGLSPVSFAKQAGTVEVILRKNGCETRSYTLEFDGSDADVNYSFSELLEESE